MTRLAFLFLAFFSLNNAIAQPQKQWLKHEINTLAGNSFSGRGYVNGGVQKAALYLQRRFRDIGLQSFSSDSSFLQPYTFPVNTFPGEVFLKLGKKILKPGEDYIIHEESNGIKTPKQRLHFLDLKSVKDSADWIAFREEIKPGKAYFLKNWDTLVTSLKLNRRGLKDILPPGLFIISRHGKLTWSVGTDTLAATIFYVEDTVLPKRMRKVSAMLQSKFIPAFKSNNVVAFVPGNEVPDSFIVFSAHFDHLGKMGRHTTFPGALDNASGTAMMMGMAQYFVSHPQRYSIMFAGFSGEEAGLLGSQFFVQHPLFPLPKIKMVFNLDLIGDAQNGITVVNAKEQSEVYKMMNALNDSLHLLSKITERDQAKNSDHYPFSQQDVPAIFIYTNGTKPFYHDVFDVPKEITLTGIEALGKLLIAAVEGLQH